MGNLFGDRDLVSAANRGRRRSLTPLLVIVFLASYGLMTTLIVEQGNTIRAQSNLIHILQRDSRELWAAKSKAQMDQAARAKAQTPSADDQLVGGRMPAIQTPASQVPSSKQSPAARTHSPQGGPSAVPSNEAPSHQPQHSQGREAAGKKPKAQAPEEMPPMPASDLGDQRRVLITL